MKKTTFLAWLPATLLVLSGSALAVPIPAGLVITGTVSVDAVNSVLPFGGSTQSGTVSHDTGAAPATTSSFVADPTTLAPSLLTGALTDIGGGIGAALAMSGLYDDTTGTPAGTDGLFADYLISLVNSSATETFTVTFRATAVNSISATGGDAFVQSTLSVMDESFTEVYFSDHRADTLSLSDTGLNFMLESASDLFDVTLAPGASASFTAQQTLRGGVFATGAYSASLDGFLRIHSVTGVGGPGPTPVPLPGTLALFGLGLLLLAGSRRRA